MIGRRLLTPVAGWAAFLLLAAVAAGGLGWVTVAALNVEAAERDATARADALNQERLALWQLDGRLFPYLGVENDRPFAHYYALSLQPVIGFAANGDPMDGPAKIPSPLLTADLPGWMRLHFQLDPDAGWSSPQVMPPEIVAQLPGEDEGFPPPTNATAGRRELLDCLRRLFPARDTHAQLIELEAADPSDSALTVPFPLATTNEPGENNLKDANPPAPQLAQQQAAGGYAGPGGFGGPGNRATPLQSRGATPQDSSFAARKQAIDASLAKSMGNVNPPNELPAPAGPRGSPKPGGSSADTGNIPPAAAPVPPPGPPGGPAAEAKRAEGGPPPAADKKKDEAKVTAADAMARGPAPKMGAGPPPAGGMRTLPKPMAEAAKEMKANARRNNFGNLRPPAVHVGPVRPHWLTAADGSRHLVLVRAARLESKILFQGVLLDWPQLRDELTDSVRPSLPAATLAPVADPADSSEHRMAALPVVLDAGPPPATPPAGWSPLRLGLALTWAAAAVALAAVGAGGRALVALSERRIRFVSAVTHELRTPLTSLRLYLDLLTSGMVSDEGKKAEYLHTLSTESDRLNRLIENVLDFARLEKRTLRTHVQPVALTDLLADAERTWADRLKSDGKELVVVSTLPPDLLLTTDPRMVGQVLGNLIDNARKYSKAADDPRVWLWAKPGDGKRVVFEVEDRGPGVPAADRCTVFRPFRRGADADTTAGGAGLGLALAKQWAELLGGGLTCRAAAGGVGACFRLELPCR